MPIRQGFLVSMFKGGFLFISLPAWLVLTIIPQFSVKNWEDFVSLTETKSGQMFQLFGVLVFILMYGLHYRKNIFHVLKNSVLRKGNVFIFLFLCYCMLSAVWSIAPAYSFLYSALMFSVFLAANLNLEVNDQKMEKLYTLSALVIVVTLLLLALSNGFGGGESGRTVGGVRANTYAKMALAAFMLASFSRTVLAVWIRMVSIPLMLIVGSRGSILFLFLFSMLWYILPMLQYKSGALKLYMFSIIGVVSVICMSLFFPIFELASDFLKLDDSARGMSSGLTGRFDYWSKALSAIAEQPLTGYGMRTRGSTYSLLMERTNAHQGFLNLILDLGLIGFLLFIFSVFFKLLSSKQNDNKRTYIFRRSVIITIICSWFLEPNYLNIGIPLTVVLLFVWFSPVSYPKSKKLRGT